MSLGPAGLKAVLKGHSLLPQTGHSLNTSENKKVKVLVGQSCPTLCNPVDCITHQAPLSMGFSRQACWNGLPFLSPGNLPDPGIRLGSPAWQADSSPSELPGNELHLQNE